jgi:hypothetical protein
LRPSLVSRYWCPFLATVSCFPASSYLVISGGFVCITLSFPIHRQSISVPFRIPFSSFTIIYFLSPPPFNLARDPSKMVGQMVAHVSDHFGVTWYQKWLSPSHEHVALSTSSWSCDWFKVTFKTTLGYCTVDITHQHCHIYHRLLNNLGNWLLTVSERPLTPMVFTVCSLYTTMSST